VDHRIPKVGGLISVLLALGALLTFLFLNQKFEGPDPVGFIGSPYELTARFESSNTLPSKQSVLHKGVSVGRVNSVDYDDETDEAVVTFTLDGDFGPIYRDAKLRIGERSLLGDAYLNLLQRGTPAAGELEPGDEVTGALSSVNFDEALDFLDVEGRERVRSLIDTVAEGVAPEGNGYRLNGTVGGLARTITELRQLTDALRGQEQQIGGLVADSATVLDELGGRERAVRSIVASGRATLDAVAANTSALEQALDELPPLLASGRATLNEARPLLSEARPVVTRLGEIAPTLRPAFDEGAPFSIGPISADLVDVIEGLEPQRRALERIGPRIVRFNRRFLPVVEKTGPTALNAVPIAGYLAPRSNSIAAFFANGASAVANGDEVGSYGRFGVVSDPGLLADGPLDGDCDPATGEPTVAGPGFCYNAYPEPDDALDHRPFSGSYPRLVPYRPPDRATLGAGP
jgi:phospholipid/cholesterol/gamma-HCH transport system substrate-binding protein